MAQRRLFAEHDADDIEAHMVPIGVGVARIVAGRGHDASFLLRIDRAIRRSIIGACPGLHLDEHNDVPIAGDDVDLTTEVGSAIIPGQDRQASLAQIPVGKVFATSSKRGVGGQQLSLLRMADCVAQAPEPLTPEPLPGREATLGLIASSVHSITFPRTM